MMSPKSFMRATRGNVSVIFALSLVAIVAATGGAVDLFNASSAKGELQDALDSAVLVGVAASSAADSSASRAFLANVKPSLQPAVQAYSSSAASSSTSAGNVTTLSYSGTASVNSPTFLMKIIGIDQIAVTARATALKSTTTPVANKPCIYVLDPTGNQSLLVNSGANITAPNCEIHVKSTGNPAGMFNSGSNLNFKKVCVKGSKVTQNSTVVKNLALSCAAEDDPYAGKLPTPASGTCNFSNGNYNGGNITMSPGVYCGWFNFNGTSNVTFNPGVYVIKGGGWNVGAGTWTGSGVTFYFADTSKIQFNSGISANLSAPTTGNYANILFYEAAGLSKSDFIFNDSQAHKFSGLIWLPSRTVTMNAKSGINSDSLTLVTWRLILNNTTWNLTPQSGTNSTSSGAASTKIRLVK